MSNSLDKRKNNGGHSTKGRAGRKPKAEEAKISNFALGAMKKAFGSEKKAWEVLAEQASKGSFPHAKLLFEYKYGKPKEQQDITVKQEFSMPLISFVNNDSEPSEFIDVTPEE